MRSQQFNLFDKETKRRHERTEHGGFKTKGRRKLERPFSSKRWLHLVLKSDKAIGPRSFLAKANVKCVREVIEAKGRKFGVNVADYVNVGNHLHLKVKAGSRLQFQMFLKAVTTLIARHVTGARRGFKFGRFWQGLAYTRVLRSRFEELRLRGYFQANREEVASGRAAREDYLEQFNAWLRSRRRRRASG